eukprot:1654608-Prymnesium_polylepis.1
MPGARAVNTLRLHNTDTARYWHDTARYCTIPPRYDTAVQLQARGKRHGAPSGQAGTCPLAA